mgnify:CR=1 FL=1
MHEKIDSFDRKILRELTNEARVSQTDLSERVGLSPTTCARRLARLEENRIIRGYSVDLNAEALGFVITVFVHITLERQSEESLAAFEKAIVRCPEVISCHLLSGTNDYLVQVQARDPSEGALGRVMALTAHPAFDARTPNRLRALVQVFAAFNPVRFHDPSGAGYRFLADQILIVDAFNPNVAARLVEPLGAWARYTPELGALMRAELERITQAPNLSKNVYELASKALA